MTHPDRNYRKITFFIGISFIYLMIMSATTVPTPLYPIYQAKMHFSLFMGTVIFATYILGVLLALLGFGRWSDVVGRRPVLIAAVFAALLSSALMLLSDFLSEVALPVLLLGRFFVGLAVGLFVGTATATLVELAPSRLKDKSTFISTAVNVLGLGFGPLLAGIMVEHVPPQLQSVFWVLLACFGLGLLIIWRMPETVNVKPGARPHMQHLALPSNVRPAFLQAAIPGFTGFAAVGLFGAVSPDLLNRMGISDPVEQGWIVFLVFAASGATQLLVKPMPLARTMQAGCVLLAVGALIIMLAVIRDSWTMLLAGGIVASVGWGAVFAKGVAHVSESVAVAERAGVTSALFVCFYIGLTAPAVGVGAAALKWGLTDATIAFALLMATLAIAALIVNLKLHDSRPLGPN
ncbi:MFS transporter [Ancylobacter sp. FA202]|uniref:MFS transporter n=1 Tax=Ancylobacter sp. FA202 TaxID=1111106 RepID=UPI001FD8F6B0|nr:MFS transporter [Ancylobacter sp. FA202]